MLAYLTDTTYQFAVLATDRNGNEKLFVVESDSIAFCNVVTAFRQLPESKGFGILESWEIMPDTNEALAA